MATPRVPDRQDSLGDTVSQGRQCHAAQYGAGGRPKGNDEDDPLIAGRMPVAVKLAIPLASALLAAACSSAATTSPGSALGGQGWHEHVACSGPQHLTIVA
jgi:hypothetical protein